MPLIDYPNVDELDGKTTEILERGRNERGEIQSFPHMLANNPAILEASTSQFYEIMYGGN